MKCRLIIITMLYLLSGMGLAQTQQNLGETTPDDNAITKLVILGTGTPIPNSDRYGPAVAVIVNDKAYVFDAGSGMTRRLHEGRGMGLPQLDPLNIQHLFITHLHSDHILDYSEFVFDYWWHRAKPIHAYGPPGLQNLNDAAKNMFAADIERRRADKNGNYPDGFQVDVNEITNDGVVFEDEEVIITAFAVEHGSWEYAYGYRVETPDKVIVISGDTKYSDNLIKYSEGADYLVHEIYSSGANSPARANFGPDTLHTSARSLAEIANMVKPELLVLYHLAAFNAAFETIAEQMGEYYQGRFIMPDDMTVIQ